MNRGAAALSPEFGAGHAATSRKHRTHGRALIFFDHPLKGVPRSPGKTSVWFAVATHHPLDCRARGHGEARAPAGRRGTRCGLPFLVRVAGMVQVAEIGGVKSRTATVSCRTK